ncbi:hypothetical protein C3941_04390 [Kaistia algarum]|uniref:outer membrane protein n=1 Tax=Kaistia algarum TaxID=2083279 RepID=UPI000CE7F658|nr:outer membrane protein [Kaistia algarum]MCX5512543.1 porin family protein [Kaistia algarum]PPE81929.1 hypothetical protein C3941_04390 [Kaistia algarum]
MRTLLLATTALTLVFLAKSASAADLDVSIPAPAPAAVPYQVPFDWSGGYAGLHAGWGWGKETDNCSQSENGPCTIGSGLGLGLGQSADSFNLNGFVGGAHIGYNYMLQQRFMFGVEGDFDYANLNGSHAFGAVGSLGTLELNTNWEGSVRLRAGYAVDRFMFFATGGVAFADADLAFNGVTDSNIHVGWTAGGGVEYALTPNLLGRFEMRYSDFNSMTYQTPLGPVDAGFDQTVATVGLSYKF